MVLYHKRYFMYIMVILGIVILSLVAVSFTKAGRTVSEPIYFFAEGKDKGFSFSDLSLLWRTGLYVGLENKSSLFWSVTALDECIKFIARQVENPINDQTAEKMQKVLNKLYAYRTKVELEQIQKRRSLTSTHEIYHGQICIIIIPNENTVYAKVVANKHDALVFALFDASAERAEKIFWQGKPVRIYFWRQKDAGYIFQSTVINSQKRENRMELLVQHSNKIVRTQKRKSVRAVCDFQALIFPMHETEPYNSAYETVGGVKCMLKDISEDGAMIFVRGKAARGVRLKLQFKIKDTPIVMCGKIVRFIYDQPTNKSRVHFQCEFLEQKMKNIILSFVYNIASEDSNEFISGMFKEDESKETEVQESRETENYNAGDIKLTDWEE